MTEPSSTIYWLLALALFSFFTFGFAVGMLVEKINMAKKELSDAKFELNKSRKS